MEASQIHLMLADDDTDDCIFFKDALADLKISAILTTAKDGVELMKVLTTQHLPEVLFLDLNMPRKNGLECLSEIKQNPILKDLPVIIFSTSFDKDVVDLLHERGAHYYIRKPAEFSKLKQLIHTSLSLVANANKSQPGRDRFVLNDA